MEPATSRSTVLLVVGFLGAALLMCIVGSLVLAAMHVEIPGMIADVAKVGLGAMAGMLASTRSVPPVVPDNPPVEQPDA